MSKGIALRPMFIASVSGGKDSLYMLQYILTHREKYPLDMVVHFEMETDWDFSKKVIDVIEEMCKVANVPFWRIKPRKSWKELYDKYGYPSYRYRWCNSKYKLDCEKQLNEYTKSLNCRPVIYIGFCADETKRFKYEIGSWTNEKCRYCYPLAEEGIEESTVLEWARSQPIMGKWYRIFNRQGCMGCPMSTRLELAYMYKYYPDKYEFFVRACKDWELRLSSRYGKTVNYFSKQSTDDVDKLIRTKWLKILNDKESG